ILVDWNADTGELIHVVCGNPTNQDLRKPVISCREAVFRSRYWMYALGIAATASRWRLAGEPSHDSQGNYAVYWIALDRKALLIVQDRTGELIRVTMEYNMSPLSL